MKPDPPLLCVNGLAKYYGERVGCCDVGFDLYPGEVLSVVGEFGLRQVDAARLAVDHARPDGRHDRLSHARRSAARCARTDRGGATAADAHRLGLRASGPGPRVCAWRFLPAPMSASG